jgi:cell division protein ZapD
VVAVGGNFQQTLPAGRVYHLLRARIDDDDLVPEITGHRLIVSVRLMRADTEGRLRPAGGDPDFELTVCA